MKDQGARKMPYSSDSGIEGHTDSLSQSQQGVAISKRDNGISEVLSHLLCLAACICMFHVNIRNMESIE